MFKIRSSVHSGLVFAISLFAGSSAANAANTTTFTSPVNPAPYTAVCTISFGGTIDWVPVLDTAPSSVYLQVARVDPKTGVTLAYAFNGAVPPSDIDWGWFSVTWAVPVSAWGQGD